MSRKRLLAAVGALALCSAAAAAAAIAPIKEYAVSIVPDTRPSGCSAPATRFPRRANRASSYQMVGIPDGLGAYASGHGAVTVYMNQELGSAVLPPSPSSATL